MITPARAPRFHLLALAALFWLGLSPSAGAAGNVVLSQVYGGGGNSGSVYRNDFIEIFNRSGSAVSLNGWSVQYASSAGTSWQVTNLTNVMLQPGQYYLIQEAQGAGGTTNLPTPDAVGTISMSGTAGKVALVSSTTALSGACPTGVVDFVGFGSAANCFEGAGPTPAPSNSNSVIRAGNGCTDTDSNSADFTAVAAAPRNSASATSVCGGPTSPSGVGASNPSSVQAGAQTLLTLTVTPGTNPASTGLAASVNLTAIGGPASQQLFDDGTNGDVSIGDNVFSYLATVANGTTAGNKTLPATITDAEMRTGSGSIPLFVEATLRRIWEIQGSSPATPPCNVPACLSRSAFAGQLVTLQGIVTARKSNGFFVQEPDPGDSDPSTSDGLFIFTSSTPPVAAAVGAMVKVSGTVQEFSPSSDPNSPPQTEISGTPTVSQVSTGNPLPAAIALTDADFSPTGGLEQLERFEAMRVQIAGMRVVAPTGGSITESSATSVSSGVLYVVPASAPGPLREPGVQVPDPIPSPDPGNVPRFDNNPERLRVSSLAQPGSGALDLSTPPGGSSITISGAGVLDYQFRSYMLDLDPVGAVSSTQAAVPVRAPAADEFTVGSTNLERFYDTVDDAGTSDVVLTATAFNNRLNKGSLAIRNVMQTPDIVGVEEMENLSTLQALASKINSDAVAASQPNPNYQAFLVEGNDIGGIDVGFLVKSTVSVISVTQVGKDATYIDPSGASALLNDRPSLVLEATVGAANFPITVIVNHLRSLSGVDDPVDGNRVRTKRRAQAEWLANYVQGRQLANPAERILLVGDFNAFEVNDGYVDSMGTIRGVPTPGDQVLLASSDLVNPDLTELSSTLPADQRYSFVFDGIHQLLDHELSNVPLNAYFRELQFGRNNADFAEVLRNDPNRPERLSDHDMPVAYFKFTPPSLSIAGVTVTEGDSGSQNASFAVTLSAAAALPVTVDYATADASATAGFDYTTTSGTLTFAAAETSKSILVPVLGDTLSELTETFQVNLGNAMGATISQAQGIGTITDNDPLPSLSIDDVAVTEGDSGTSNATFTVTLAPASGQVVTVAYATANGTASQPGDYTSTSGTLTFAAGTTTQQISVPVVGDLLDEDNETFLVNLTTPGAATIGDNQGVGTINDNDPLPGLSINDVAVTEGDSGTTNAVFTVSLTAASGRTVMVAYATANGTAIQPGDYTTTSGTLTISAGSTTGQITVPVVGDLVDEDNETFFVNLSAATNASITDNQGLGTITDNDPLPGLSINDVTLTEGDSGITNALFTVTLSPASGRGVSVAYATANGTAVAPGDYTSGSGTLSFAAGATTAQIMVPVVGDLLDEDNETFFVNLSGATNASITDAQGLGTITDNDPLPGLSINDLTIAEGGGNAMLTVTLGAVSGRTVTVAYATADGTATAPGDYTSTSGVLTFAAGTTTQQVSVPVANDLISEPDETFLVNLSGAVNASITDAQGQVTILDDAKARMLSPTPGSTLTSDPVTFVWAPGTQSTRYWLEVGTTPGGSQIYTADQGTGTSVSVSGFPTTAASVYVRLWSFLPAPVGWVYNDYTYTGKTGLKAEMVSPAPGSQLTSTSVTFTWSAGVSARQYWLDIGNKVGGSNLYSASQGLGLSATVSNLPSDSSTLYVRLWTRFGDRGWQYNDYTYVSAQAGPAVLTSPTPGTTLAGTTVTFGWSAGSTALEYWLDVGTTLGGTQIYSAPQGTGLSATVSGLPSGGVPVYVRLWSRLPKLGWTYNEYTYTAAP
jgi:predicted extracellular nuclease